VICSHCQTEIADKALICYRCGRATREPRIRPPAPESIFARRRRLRWPLLIGAVLGISAAVTVWILMAT
jgi:hypothetical protein